MNSRLILNGKGATYLERKNYVWLQELGRIYAEVTAINIDEENGTILCSGPWINAESGETLNFIDWPEHQTRVFPLTIIQGWL